MEVVFRKKINERFWSCQLLLTQVIKVDKRGPSKWIDKMHREHNFIFHRLLCLYSLPLTFFPYSESQVVKKAI